MVTPDEGESYDPAPRHQVSAMRCEPFDAELIKSCAAADKSLNLAYCCSAYG